MPVGFAGRTPRRINYQKSPSMLADFRHGLASLLKAYLFHEQFK
jgi:hypothetical protein